jgi:hypothetical protein
MDYLYTFVGNPISLNHSSLTLSDRLHFFCYDWLWRFGAHYASRSFHLCCMGFSRCCDHDDFHFGLAFLCLAWLDNIDTSARSHF